MNNGASPRISTTRLGTVVAFDVENLHHHATTSPTSDPGRRCQSSQRADGRRRPCTALAPARRAPARRTRFARPTSLHVGAVASICSGRRLQFFRNSMVTEVGLRSLSFVDRVSVTTSCPATEYQANRFGAVGVTFLGSALLISLLVTVLMAGIATPRGSFTALVWDYRRPACASSTARAGWQAFYTAHAGLEKLTDGPVGNLFSKATSRRPGQQMNAIMPAPPPAPLGVQVARHRTEETDTRVNFPAGSGPATRRPRSRDGNILVAGPFQGLVEAWQDAVPQWR